jgi:hypothetical protein
MREISLNGRGFAAKSDVGVSQRRISAHTEQRRVEAKGSLKS